MLLTIDIGNTHIKMGLYRGAELVQHWRIVTDKAKLADDYGVLVQNLFQLSKIETSSIRGCVLSCVVPPLSSQFIELSRRYLRHDPLVVSTAIETGLRYRIDFPEELGGDRITNSLAAYRTYGGPVIAVAFGTATAFDVVTSDGCHIGGAIAPGIGISAQALFHQAARLHQVDLVRPPAAIGKNTVHSMQSGIILGHAGLVEGLVNRMQTELGTACPVVATGGLAEVIAAETTAITVVHPHLTLEGLRLVYELNRGSSA